MEQIPYHIYYQTQLAHYLLLPILETVVVVGGVVDILDQLMIPPTCVDVGADTVPE